ncbi:MAG: hypothetical protein DRQ55_05265 [Planctomycetota bacterium]|nr:MAG: hypothetical protein DRQ55_05265 [Planctomycetota bacterium]
MRPIALLLAVLAFLSAPAAAFDRVLLKDGRAIEGKLIDSEDSGFIMLRLPGADVPIPLSMVDKTFVEDLDDYVPKNKKEEKYLRQGKVLFEGSWMSRTRREQQLQKRRDADEGAIKQAREEQKWKNHKQLNTRHFDIASNCTQEVLDEYADMMEAYYKYFTDFWHIKLKAKDAKRRMKFFMYRNAADFHAITGMRRGVLGYFQPTTGELHLFDMFDDRAYAQAVMFHEGNHLLTHLIDTGYLYPPWMNEGMAEYYGSAKINEQSEFEIGGLQYGRIAAMRHDDATGQALRIRDVMLAPRGGGYTARHYSYGWSFVHFLMETPKYAKSFRGFFKNLPDNPGVETSILTWQKGAFTAPSEESVIEAFESRMGKSVEDLEDEWRLFIAQAYGELSPNAYYFAARLFKNGEPLENDQHVVFAMEFYDKAVQAGIENAKAYREYAEMLRKGGMDESSSSRSIIITPDPVKAWLMCQRAIELDPIDPLNYMEGAGALIMNSPAQDLDQAYALAETAKALAPRSYRVTTLYDELMSLIEPARERARERAEMEQRLATLDLRQWIVQPFHFDNEEEPEQTPEMSTEELRELLAEGLYDGDDWVFQAYRWADETTGELTQGTEPWDIGWVQLKDVPLFADDLAQAGD